MITKRAKMEQALPSAYASNPVRDGGAFLVSSKELNLLKAETVVRGKRAVVQNVRGTPTVTRTWHTFQVRLQGKSLAVQLDWKEYLRRELEAPHSGRCGLWSKADSQVLFGQLHQIAKHGCGSIQPQARSAATSSVMRSIHPAPVGRIVLPQAVGTIAHRCNRSHPGGPSAPSRL